MSFAVLLLVYYLHSVFTIFIYPIFILFKVTTLYLFIVIFTIFIDYIYLSISLISYLTLSDFFSEPKCAPRRSHSLSGINILL